MPFTYNSRYITRDNVIALYIDNELKSVHLLT